MGGGFHTLSAPRRAAALLECVCMLNFLLNFTLQGSNFTLLLNFTLQVLKFTLQGC